MTIDVTRRARIEAVIGASGSGKSAYIKREIRDRKPERLMIFDPEGEYLDFGREVKGLGDVASVLAQCVGGKPFRLVFAPHADPGRAAKQFDMLCRLAFEAGELMFVAEELADVTSASRAPVGWSMMTRRGRKRGIEIIGATQRPASIDKTFLGNCTKVRAGRLLYEEDARAVAKVLGVAWEGFLSMEALHYVEREPPAAAVRGVLKF